MRTVRAQHGTADLGHQFGAQLLALGLQGALQLSQRGGPELAVAGPLGVIEGVPGRGDGALHVGAGGIGGAAEDLLRGRVDVVELASGLGLDELAVDQHAGFVGHDVLHHCRSSLTESDGRGARVR